MAKTAYTYPQYQHFQHGHGFLSHGLYSEDLLCPSRAEQRPLGTEEHHDVPNRSGKYVFLVRHAQSRWNVLNDSLKGLDLMTAVTAFGEVADADHGLSDVGKDQAEELRERIRQKTVDGCNQDQHFYNAFVRSKRTPIFCSPMRRALQTASLVFPSDDGWSTIRLLKCAKELRNHFWEIDCGSTEDNLGNAIAENALNELGEDSCRVDAEDCTDMWWSTAGESPEEQDEQLTNLWKTLVSEPGVDHVVVTHSNLIRRLLSHLVEVAPADLSTARSSKLQNCNMLGLRIAPSSNTASTCIWQDYEVMDVCLMFDSGFEDQ